MLNLAVIKKHHHIYINIVHSDPLVTKLDFDKDSTPGRKHYPVHHDSHEPLAQDKMPGKEEVQVQCAGNYKYCCWGRYVVTDKQETAAAELLVSLKQFIPVQPDKKSLCRDRLVRSSNKMEITAMRQSRKHIHYIHITYFPFTMV